MHVAKRQIKDKEIELRALIYNIQNVKLQSFHSSHGNNWFTNRLKYNQI